jgi:hypothetical protein
MATSDASQQHPAMSFALVPALIQKREAGELSFLKRSGIKSSNVDNLIDSSDPSIRAEPTPSE